MPRRRLDGDDDVDVDGGGGGGGARHLTASHVLAKSLSTRALGSASSGSFPAFKAAPRPVPGEDGRVGWNWGGGGGSGWSPAVVDRGCRSTPSVGASRSHPPTGGEEGHDGGGIVMRAFSPDQAAGGRTRSRHVSTPSDTPVGRGLASHRQRRNVCALAPGVHVDLPDRPGCRVIAPWGPGGVAPRSPMSGRPGDATPRVLSAGRNAATTTGALDDDDDDVGTQGAVSSSEARRRRGSRGQGRGAGARRRGKHRVSVASTPTDGSPPRVTRGGMEAFRREMAVAQKQRRNAAPLRLRVELSSDDEETEGSSPSASSYPPSSSEDEEDHAGGEGGRFGVAVGIGPGGFPTYATAAEAKAAAKRKKRAERLAAAGAENRTGDVFIDPLAYRRVENGRWSRAVEGAYWVPADDPSARNRMVARAAEAASAVANAVAAEDRDARAAAISADRERRRRDGEGGGSGGGLKPWDLTPRRDREREWRAGVAAALAAAPPGAMGCVRGGGGAVPGSVLGGSARTLRHASSARQPGRGRDAVNLPTTGSADDLARMFRRALTPEPPLPGGIETVVTVSTVTVGCRRIRRGVPSPPPPSPPPTSPPPPSPPVEATVDQGGSLDEGEGEDGARMRGMTRAAAAAMTRGDTPEEIIRATVAAALSCDDGATREGTGRATQGGVWLPSPGGTWVPAERAREQTTGDSPGEPTDVEDPRGGFRLEEEEEEETIQLDAFVPLDESADHRGAFSGSAVSSVAPPREGDVSRLGLTGSGLGSATTRSADLSLTTTKPPRGRPSTGRRPRETPQPSRTPGAFHPGNVIGRGQVGFSPRHASARALNRQTWRRHVAATASPASTSGIVGRRLDRPATAAARIPLTGPRAERSGSARAAVGRAHRCSRSTLGMDDGASSVGGWTQAAASREASAMDVATMGGALDEDVDGEAWGSGEPPWSDPHSCTAPARFGA